MGTVNINGTFFRLENELNINYNNNEDLGSVELTMILSAEFDLGYFDEIVLSNGDCYYLVDWGRKRVGSNEYRYNLSVVNPVIQLQNIILPTRVIDKGTKTIDVLNRFRDMYAPTLIISDELRSLVGDSITMEHIWNKPTFYEVINDLLQPFNAIVNMSDFNDITYISLDKMGDEIDHKTIVNLDFKSDYLNHATTFNSTLENAISDNVIIEYAHFITPNEPILNDKRFRLELAHPIENITRVRFYYMDDDGIKVKDITSMVVEKTIYDTFSNSINTGIISGDYLRTHIFYKTGENYIDGFDFNEASWIPVIKINRTTWDYFFEPIELGNNRHPSSTFVSVEYTAQLQSVDVELEKNALATQNKTMIMNQDESNIDLDNFATKQTLMLERNGNIGVTIYGIDKLPKLMDSYKGYNIYAIKASYNKGNLNWLAYAKREFAFMNLRSKVSSEKKFTAIESPDKAFISNHITKYNFEFVEEQNEIKDNLYNIGKTFTLEKIWSIIESFGYLITGRHSILTPLLEKYGNSLLINFRMKDNYSAGTSNYGVQSFGEVRQQREHNYVNEETGQFTSLFFSLYLGGVYQLTDIPNMITFMNALPNPNYANKSFPDEYFGYRGLRYKTSREITAETIQFNLLSNENVIIWDNFIDMVSWGELVDNNEYLVSYNLDPNRKFSKMDFRQGTIPPFDDELVKFKAVGNEIYLDNARLIDYYGFILYNKSTLKPILAYNGMARRLWLREVVKRPKNDYSKYVSDVFLTLDSEQDINITHSTHKYDTLMLGLDYTQDIKAYYYIFRMDEFFIDLDYKQKIGVIL